jgi:hypothetical protein
MSIKSKSADELASGAETDAELRQALGNFRASVCAWSDAAYNRPRTVSQTAPHGSWRLVAGWALGCVLVAGGVSGSVYEHHLRQEKARIAATHEAERQRPIAPQVAAQVAPPRTQEPAPEEEELLAKVDSTVAREAPDALEPLASLMDEDETR